MDISCLFLVRLRIVSSDKWTQVWNSHGFPTSSIVAFPSTCSFAGGSLHIIALVCGRNTMSPPGGWLETLVTDDKSPGISHELSHGVIDEVTRFPCGGYDSSKKLLLNPERVSLQKQTSIIIYHNISFIPLISEHSNLLKRQGGESQNQCQNDKQQLFGIFVKASHVSGWSLPPISGNMKPPSLATSCWTSWRVSQNPWPRGFVKKSRILHG